MFLVFAGRNYLKGEVHHIYTQNTKPLETTARMFYFMFHLQVVERVVFVPIEKHDSSDNVLDKYVFGNTGTSPFFLSF